MPRHKIQLDGKEVEVECSEEFIQDYKARETLVQSYEEAQYSDPEQIRMWVRFLEKFMQGPFYHMERAYRTPEPTEEEIQQWQEDYQELCKIDLVERARKFKEIGLVVIEDNPYWYDEGYTKECPYGTEFDSWGFNKQKSRWDESSYVDWRHDPTKEFLGLGVGFAFWGNTNYAPCRWCRRWPCKC